LTNDLQDGFEHPTAVERTDERKSGALAGLIASAALAIGTIVAATAVSIGIARADGVGGLIENEGGLFLIALLLGVLFVCSTLSKAMTPKRPHSRQYHSRNYHSRH
jgi:hypothetical protein